MYKKLLNALLIFILSIGSLSGCSESSSSNTIAEGYDILGGEWSVAAIYYKDKYNKNHLIDISDNDALQELYDTYYLNFYEGGTFVKMDLIYNDRGKYIKQDDDSFILKTETVFSYEFAEEGMIEKEKEDAEKIPSIIRLLDENTLILNTLDPVTGKEKLGSEPKIYKKIGTESEYIQQNKTPLNSDASSSSVSTPSPETNNQSEKKDTSNKTDYTQSNTKFTNKYGTATTYCVQNGCNNYIASSGDTNCCTKHSARCLNCNCYIDGDAMYCMSCMSGSAKSSSSSSSSSYSNSSSSADTCKFKYSSGAVCGAKINNYKSLCDKHFHELNNIYQSFTN